MAPHAIESNVLKESFPPPEFSAPSDISGWKISNRKYFTISTGCPLKSKLQHAGRLRRKESCYMILSYLLWYQVIPGHGNLQKRWTMFGGYLFKYFCVKYQLFTRFVRRHPSKKHLTPKSYLKSFLDASESHKTSANLSVRAYFRQFSDW